MDTKKTTPNIEVWPESLRAMLEYWYIECGLLHDKQVRREPIMIKNFVIDTINKFYMF